MTCKICQTRRPRRHCPGVEGEICTVCCGTEREITVRCPFDCEFLQEARKHERNAEVDPDKFPNQDIRISENFLREHQHLLLFLARTLLESAFQNGAVDPDVRQAVDALVRTYRTRESGLYYETRPDGNVAARLSTRVQEAIEELRNHEQEQGSVTPTRDADLLGMLAFVQRLELSRSNGRPLGRAFLDFLRAHFPHDAAAVKPDSSLIIP
ncbi:MAG: hypothetical protein ACRD8O_19620 [Bryobacteraceae bacterium]